MKQSPNGECGHNYLQDLGRSLGVDSLFPLSSQYIKYVVDRSSAVNTQSSPFLPLSLGVSWTQES